jgi:hypothetical protein
MRTSADRGAFTETTGLVYGTCRRLVPLTDLTGTHRQGARRAGRVHVGEADADLLLGPTEELIERCLPAFSAGTNVLGPLRSSSVSLPASG